MLAFQERYGSEAGCIEALARLRWPHGYVCAACGAPSRQRPPPLSWAHELGGFVRAAVRPGSRLVSDDFKGYAGLRGTDRHPPPSSKATARTPSGSCRSSMSRFPT